MEITSTIEMDLVCRKETPVVNAVQNDTNSRTVKLLLFENGTAWTPTEVTAALAFRKPDGTAGLYDEMPDGTAAITLTDNAAAIRLAPQVLTVPGMVQAALVLNSDGTQLATFQFRIHVAENPGAEGGISNDYYRYQTLRAINTALGDLTQLDTENKDSLVEAVNEVFSYVSDPVTIDATLTQSGSAADAKAAGNAISGCVSFRQVQVLTEAQKELVRENIGAVKDAELVADYLSDEVTAVMNRLRSVQRAHPKAATFAFMTDLHFHYNQIGVLRHNLRCIDEIAKSCPVAFLAHGGDNLAESENTLGNALNLAQVFGDILREYKVRSLPVKGNHDDNTLSGYIEEGSYPVEYAMTDAQYYARCFRQNENVFNICMDENRDRLYYYVDLPSQQIRFIFLNVIDIPILDDGTGELVYKGCRDSGYSNEQLNWVVKDALDFSDKKHPEQWGVITVQHFTDNPNIAPFSGGSYVQQDHGGEAMYNIFKAFRNRKSYSSTVTDGDFAHNVSCDFSGAQQELICRISGHTHKDWYVTHDDILYISTMSAGPNGVGNSAGLDGNTYEKTESTPEESAFDFLTVDKENHTIYATRFGAGEDRIFSWVTARTEILETVGTTSDGIVIDGTTYTYTEGTDSSYGLVVAKQSSIAGGLLSVDWDTGKLYDFQMLICLFDSTGNGYMHTGQNNGGDGGTWVTTSFAGELYEPYYFDISAGGKSYGYAHSPFTVQIPEGCTCMCGVRYVPSDTTTQSPDGSITTAAQFREWVMSGGVTFTVSKG